MSFSNSFPASHTAPQPEHISPVSPIFFRHSMSQGGYISALVTNHSRSPLFPLAGITSGYSQVVNAERSAISSDAWSNLSDLATQTPEFLYSPSTMHNNNMIALPPLASRAFMPSDYSHLQSNSMAGTNRAAFCSYSDHFASSTHNIFPVQLPGASWADNFLSAQQASTALIPSGFSSSSPLPSNILPVVDRSCVSSKRTVDFLPRVHRCITCGATFPTYQALGGHRGCHTREKRKRELLNLMPGTSHPHAKDEGGSSGRKISKRKSF